jgi:hypothetical protein
MIMFSPALNHACGVFSGTPFSRGIRHACLLQAPHTSATPPFWNSMNREELEGVGIDKHLNSKSPQLALHGR